MIKLFRNIRKKLVSDKPSVERTTSYLKYAIGEIILVVVGILIALQVNNWNEQRKDNAKMRMNVNSIGEDIQTDFIELQKTIQSLHQQEEAARNIIPIMESENKFIADSLQFILDFNALTTTPIIEERINTWTFLNSSGILSEFPDTKLLKMLQDYYNEFRNITTNFTNSANPVRLELRKLKYELFTDIEHRKFFPTKTPKAPNGIVYTAIFEDKRILALSRFIGSTASYFENRFKTIESKAEDIIDYIEKNYTQEK